MERYDVEEEGLGEKAFGESGVCRRGEYVGGGDGIGRSGDAVGREERVTFVRGCGDGASGKVVELL